MERHLAECPACAELARDSAAAVAFMESAAEVEPPPELITRILFDAPWSKGKQKSKLREWVGALFSPILQPKFAMGMAMTILSLSMLARFVMPVRQLRPADLQPGEGVGGARGPRLAHLGADREVLRKFEDCVSDSNDAEGMAAAGRRAEAGGRQKTGRTEAAGESLRPSTRRAPLPNPTGYIEGYVMNCQNHPEVPATAYCRTCGKAGVRRMPP